MKRLDERGRLRDPGSPSSAIRQRRYLQNSGAALLGYFWASFLIAAAGAGSLLARLTKRR